MSLLPWVKRINASRVVEVTPTITANSAYVSGNQLGGIMQITDVIRQDSNMKLGQSELVGVTILDSNKQDVQIDVWFFKVSPTLASADHAAFNITAANQALQCIGSVKLGVFPGTTTSNYSDATVCSNSSNPNLNDLFQVDFAAAASTSVFAVAIVRGTPTYTTTSALKFQFKFFLD